MQCTAGFGCHSLFLLKAKEHIFFLPLSEQLFPDGGNGKNPAVPISENMVKNSLPNFYIIQQEILLRLGSCMFHPYFIFLALKSLPRETELDCRRSYKNSSLWSQKAQKSVQLSQTIATLAASHCCSTHHAPLETEDELPRAEQAECSTSETSDRSGITKYHLVLHRSTNKTPEQKSRDVRVFSNFTGQILEGGKPDLLKIATHTKVSHLHVDGFPVE